MPNTKNLKDKTTEDKNKVTDIGPVRKINESNLQISGSVNLSKKKLAPYLTPAVSVDFAREKKELVQKTFVSIKHTEPVAHDEVWLVPEDFFDYEDWETNNFFLNYFIKIKIRLKERISKLIRQNEKK